MEYVELGRNGLKVSIIGLGAWQASGKAWGADVEDDEIVKAIVRANELGVNLIDTAEAYGGGHSEEVVARAIRVVGRENLVIATKVHGGHLRYNDVLKAAEHSLRRLGVREIDLYQVHWPDPWEQVPLKHTMCAMERLYKEGKIRAIGVSNFAVRDLEEARRYLSEASIVSNQVRYNMLQREIEEEVLPYCRKENITVIAYSPLAQGALTGKYGLSNKPSDNIRRGNKLFTDENLAEISRLLKVLEKIAKERGKTIAQVAMNWLLREGNIVPIPGAKNPMQAEENAGAAGWRLNERELTEIESVLKTLSLDLF
ncbi:MAG: aldo/keto reductase [Crenarchaeota archaeon]|nr:aldo/keto reductase [Thermoproteota archaeon]